MAMKRKRAIPEIVRLRKFKQKSGWSYEKIGLRMGVHHQSVVFWLGGQYRPSPMAREKIVKFLDEFFIE